MQHTGRFLDSTQVGNFQHKFIRTLRSRRIRLARTQRGTAPPRAYIQLGSAIGVYSLDRFFSISLPGGMKGIDGVSRGGYDPEKYVKWDAVVHPEGTSSGWNAPYSDGQDRMFDFDFDDRGYVYAAAGKFGWGIVKDGGEINGSNLDLAKQIIGEGFIDDPRMIVAFKTGGKYYAVVSDDLSGKGRQIWDVTNPNAPLAGAVKQGADFSFISWAKDDVNGRLAIVTQSSRNIEIYDYASIVAGGGPIATYDAGGSKAFKDVTADENGNFWTSEVTDRPGANMLIKLERTGSGYTKRPFDVLGKFTSEKSFTVAFNTIEYGDKHLAITGKGEDSRMDVRLFKIEGGEPVNIELNQFFHNYYWAPPKDYAMPLECAATFGAYPIKWNNKVYLFNSTNGLGDVFELQAGDSIITSLKSGTPGTANPHAKPTESGPFYADPLTFRAESSNPTVGYNVNWDFDNTESGADNTVASRTGQDVEHQFTGLSTAAKIGETRRVKATAAVSSDMSDTVNVTLKVPTARIGVSGLSTAFSTDNAAIDLVAGDLLTDASDGTVQSHYAEWTIDNTTTKLVPGATIAAGNVGAHTVTLAAKYGKYDASFNTVGSPYVDTVSAVAYTVRPFIVALGVPTTSGNTVTFRGTARVTPLASVLTAALWTVEWTLKNPAGEDVVPPQSGTPAVGTIPNFTVADKTAIPSGSILKLKVTVDPLGLVGDAAALNIHKATQTLITPDPKINKAGCANTGQPCTFTATSLAGNPVDDWAIVWTLKKGTATVGTFTGNPYKPTLSEPGNYSVSLVASTSIFAGNASLTDIDVQGPICGDPPTAEQMSVFASCTSGCAKNVDITIRADPWHYDLQQCEEYQWNFGDGQTATTTTRDTKHKYTSDGTKTIRLKVKKGTAVSPEFTRTIVIGTDDEPPPTTCTFPTNIDFTFSGPNGCGVSTPCKAGQAVRFSGLRGTSTLQSCDTATWTFHDSTSTVKSPSKTYSAAGTYQVTLKVSNTVGTSANVTKSITIAPADPTSGECNAPNASNISISYRGRQSNCTRTSAQLCIRGEIIDFRAELFPINNPQSCDRFEWNFGDNTALATTQNAEHTYAANGTAATYPVSFRWYNSAGSAPFSTSVRFSEVPTIPPPVLTFTYFPTTAAKGDTVTFAATSNMDTTTGWTWTFTDGSSPDTSQASVISRTSTITHTFTKSGAFQVRVMARNSTDTSTLPPQGSVQNTITLADVVNFKYLLPAVAHAGGLTGTWRTDVQIYTSEAVSAAAPLKMTASFKGGEHQLQVPSSTYIYEDFLDVLLDRDDSGPVIITTTNAKTPPQIWTRTYNQTANGTFGQFIPAIRLDNAGGGGAFGEGKYYLAGLRHDNRYVTNVGFLNPNATAVNATVRVYDDEDVPLGSFTLQDLQPFVLNQFPIASKVTIPANRPFSLQIEVPAGQWLYAYASFIDSGSGDPVFIQAVRESELTPEDYRNILVPGVGHFNTWRSDVTIYNPPGDHGITVDLTYYDQAGNKVAETKAVPIGAGKFLQYDDLLRQGVFGSLPDSFGTLKITVPQGIAPLRFPLAFSRTYSDDGSGKTYGQGISGFAVPRANVKSTKPGLIPAIRSDANYRTDIGISNVSDAAAIATVRLLDPLTGAEFSSMQFPMVAYQSIKATDINLGGRTRASVKVEVVGGNVWAYASVIDRKTSDPEYVQAFPLP